METQGYNRRQNPLGMLSAKLGAQSPHNFLGPIKSAIFDRCKHSTFERNEQVHKANKREFRPLDMQFANEFPVPIATPPINGRYPNHTMHRLILKISSYIRYCTHRFIGRRSTVSHNNVNEYQTPSFPPPPLPQSWGLNRMQCLRSGTPSKLATHWHDMHRIASQRFKIFRVIYGNFTLVSNFQPDLSPYC